MSTVKFRYIVLFIVLGISVVFAQSKNGEYNEFRGKIIDGSTNVPLSYCNVLVSGMNIATVTNTEGEFLLKVPDMFEDVKLVIRHIGYKNRIIGLNELVPQKGIIVMEQAAFQLPQIDVLMQDANVLVKKMYEKVPENYSLQEMFMTAFYRESIRKRRNYVSLSEAVIDVQKQPYDSYRSDLAKLYKARKKTDYTKLDTLVFKLMGGPYNNLYLDMIKYPAFLFSDQMFEKYYFTFDRIEWMDDKLIYVVNFNHRPSTEEALYNGKFYIDATTMALKSAVFSLDLKNQDQAIALFIRKKPLNAKVTPVQADYRMDYIEKDGKWYYAYSRIELGMKINWKKKLFNTNYYAVIEMAVTDREGSSDSKAIKFRERLRSNVIISETVDGFSDPDFWGSLNVIEPDKPIEAAIRKIQRQLER
ncbi:MAG: carboxypeptidase-like regulatory domain-containing protein [Paludibacter sp.]|nr:carboxypeptidase-like regulatory domain-containing protein [Paludibacter sp.]